MGQQVAELRALQPRHMGGLGTLPVKPWISQGFLLDLSSFETIFYLEVSINRVILGHL